MQLLQQWIQNDIRFTKIFSAGKFWHHAILNDVVSKDISPGTNLDAHIWQMKYLYRNKSGHGSN